MPSSYKTVNVALESREDDSLLSWYQQLIQLRRANPALHDGSLTMLNVDDNNVLSWLRKTGDGQSVLAVSYTHLRRALSNNDEAKQRKDQRHLTVIHLEQCGDLQRPFDHVGGVKWRPQIEVEDAHAAG